MLNNYCYVIMRTFSPLFCQLVFLFLVCLCPYVLTASVLWTVCPCSLSAWQAKCAATYATDRDAYIRWFLNTLRSCGVKY